MIPATADPSKEMSHDKLRDRLPDDWLSKVVEEAPYKAGTCARLSVHICLAAAFWGMHCFLSYIAVGWLLTRLLSSTCRNVKGYPPLIQRWRENDYSWAGPKVWACFRPDADVLVPMYYSSPEAGIVSPFAGDRDISLLMRFEYKLWDGKHLVEHFGHRLRYELIEQWKEDPLEHSEQGLASPEVGAVPPLAFCSPGVRWPHVHPAALRCVRTGRNLRRAWGPPPVVQYARHRTACPAFQTTFKGSNRASWPCPEDAGAAIMKAFPLSRQRPAGDPR